METAKQCSAYDKRKRSLAKHWQVSRVMDFVLEIRLISITVR